MKVNYKKSKFLKMGVALIIFMVAFAGILVFANQDVRIGIKQQKNVQVVLAKGDSSLNLSNYETDLKNRLEDKGVDISKVSFEKIDTSTLSTEDIIRKALVVLGK